MKSWLREDSGSLLLGWNCEHHSELYSQLQFQYLGYLYNAWFLRMFHIIWAETQRLSKLVKRKYQEERGVLNFVSLELEASESYLSLLKT